MKGTIDCAAFHCLNHAIM
ncbi:hypothetical protein LINGRAHAP2_LOCUS14075 [Linum grandiflorum]